MARRRSFARVFRRRRTGKKPDGSRRSGFVPGYYLRVRRNGKEIWKYAGPDRETALELAARLSRASDRRDLFDEREATDLTFEAFAGEYLKHTERAMTESSHQSRLRLVNAIVVPFFKGWKLADVRAHDIQRFLASRTGITGATRNRNLTAVSAIFRRAIELGLVETNPAREVKRAKETRTSIPVMTLPDQGRLLALIPEPMRTFFMLLLGLGLRLSEGMRLEWGDIDFGSGTVTVRVSKSKRPRVVVMAADLRQTMKVHFGLRTRPLSGPDLVFPGARGDDKCLRYQWRHAFKNAAARLGMPRLRIHDLRHMHAINLVRNGIDLPTVQAVLGHTSLISTLRYAEYSDGSAAFRAARALDAMHEKARAASAGS